MSPRDRAIKIVHSYAGGGYSLGCFQAMLTDQSEPAAILRRMVSAIENGIMEDRKAIEKAQAPS